MKIFLTIFIALIAITLIKGDTDDSPTQFSNNNLGNLVNLDLRGNFNVTSETNFFLMSLITAIINQNGIFVVPNEEGVAIMDDIPETAEVSKVETQQVDVDPELVNKLLEILKR